MERPQLIASVLKKALQLANDIIIFLRLAVSWIGA
jgi:hypothetical protein